MNRVLTGTLFVSLALGAHLAVAAVALMDHSAGTAASGEGGEDLLSLQASNVALAAMVERWEEVPEVAPDLPKVPEPPKPVMEPLEEIPELELAPSDMALPVPMQPVEQAEVFDAPEPPEAPEPPKPAPKPEAKPAPKAQQSQQAQQAVQGTDRSSQETRAAGAGGGQQAGEARASQGAGLSAAKRQSALSSWGATIRSRIERRKRAPRGVGDGIVTVSFRVSREGALLSVGVAKSSGNPVLDAAAVEAVKRVGRFPAAPAELTDASYPMSLPIRFAG
ncbi:TonB family protein [Celeribacter sp. SCSIO 80788]|uniref:TonB family protein n=1 Tax=Celeribacter sp. SCSIO 80788 TaxID=3117013 RepID=UPI003DA29202